ncbi:hypothetical protein KR054_006694 [Drosophila jambulina]|nr:hypothetical protein KR054_006694 [Drosophila jambulina]
MRAATIIPVIFVLAACLLRSSDAVTCTADPTVTGCIDCTQTANAQNTECLAEATTTTVAPTTTTEATTVATVTSTAATSTATGGRRRIVRMTNMRFSATRRIRIRRNSSSSTLRTTTRNRRSNVRRVNVRNRRRNGNVRVIVG